MKTPPLLVICGATATGKTGLSIRVAQTLIEGGMPAEIISADSRQVYRGLDIGTAKATVEERAGVPHHGLDLVEPDQPFTLADYAAHARDALAEILDRGGLAILAGGTGLYLRAVGRDFDTAALPSDTSLRASLETDFLADGLEPLVARLRAAAPSRSARTDLRNPRRVVRALEIATLEGDGESPPPRGYGGPSAWLGLRVAPAVHRAWIEDRARAQFAAGLLDEARALRERFDPSLPAFSAIGYREAWAVIDGVAPVDEAIAADVQRNVAFAKRQGSWFRSEPEVTWLDADGNDPLPAALKAATRIAGEAGEAR